MKGDSTLNKNGVYGTKGISSLFNKPSSRHGATTWTDVTNNFWLFGGIGYDANGLVGYLNDLWKYNTTTNEWVWISGSNTRAQGGNYGTKGIPSVSNYPGSRYSFFSWIDASGKFWLFGV